MKFFSLSLLLFFLCLSCLIVSPLQAGSKKIIAAGGASGYLAADTLSAISLAIGMEAEYIGLDLAISKDNHIVVISDIRLNSITNVAALFPGRQRKDNSWYVVDLTLSELKQLHLQDSATSGTHFTIPTFTEAVQLIRALEASLQRKIGVYAGIHQPWFHRKEGKDISYGILKVLQKYGYTSREEKVYLKCFDPDELKKIRTVLMPLMTMDLPLIQFIDHNKGQETKQQRRKKWASYNYAWMFSKSGMKIISSYADGIGLDKSMLVSGEGIVLQQDYVTDAHTLGLEVHAYGVKKGADQLPAFIENFAGLLYFLFFNLDLDAVITNHCLEATTFLNSTPQTPVEAEPLPEAKNEQQVPPLIKDDQAQPFSSQEEISSTPDQL